MVFHVAPAPAASGEVAERRRTRLTGGYVVEKAADGAKRVMNQKFPAVLWFSSGEECLGRGSGAEVAMS